MQESILGSQEISHGRARDLVSSAKQRGDLVPQPCRDCESLKVHAHHHDYQKPLEVIWLCQKHHTAEHTRIGRPRKANPKNKVIAVQIEEELRKMAEKRASKEGRTMSGLLRWALIQYLSTPQEGGK